MKDKLLFVIHWISIFIVSISMFAYGASKSIQFRKVSEVVDLSTISGQDLMWAFYGYSVTYPIIIGVFQVIGAISLLFAKTRLFGCLLLSTILFNIIIQDFIYDVNHGAFKSAILYQVLLFLLMAFNFTHMKEVIKILFQKSKTFAIKNKIIFLLLSFIIAVIWKNFETRIL